jgi:16S rRNA G1207 methylase RsmC
VEDEPDLEFNEEDQFSLGILRTPRPEQYLIDFWKTAPVESALCTSLGRGQFAAHLAEHSPQARVVCNFIDLYAASESRDFHGKTRPNLTITCEPDLSGGVYDLCALPVSRGGEAELTREMLQRLHQNLRDGGTFLASSDNWKDTWLRDELTAIFSTVEKHPCRGGVVYAAKKKGELKRVRDFSAEFAFRDEGRLIKAFSRPGVFSHRKLDLGARALLEVVKIQAGDRMLDIGCGSGVVGLAAAQRAENVSVLAIDSNCRAVECSRRGAELNGLTAYEARLEANGQIDSPGQFDVAVGNPPYYSQYKIANLFLMAAHAALKPGGRVYMVTKHADWFDARMRQLFDGIELVPSREYIVVTGRKR